MSDHQATAPESADYVLEVVRPWRARSVSAGIQAITGFAPEEFLADPALFASRIHADDLPRVLALYPEVMKRGSVRLDYRFQHKHGTYRWIHDTVKLELDATGRPSALCGHAVDVTIERDPTTPPFGTEGYFRHLIERASDVFLVVGPDGTIRYESPSVRRLAGFTSAEVVGRNAYDFVHPDDVPELKRQLSLALAQMPGLVPAEFRHLRADGTWRFVEAVASRLVEDGEVTGAVVNMRDISERKRLEEQLQQARRMEAVGRLAGGIAHDFNNLLTAVIGYAELLLDQVPGDSPLRPDLEEIRSAGESAATLTRALLAFGRRQLMEPRQLGLNDLLAETVTMIRRLMGESVTCETRFDTQLADVHADAGQLEQVLLNLCVNAREAMPEGGVLTIATERVVLESPRTVRHWTVPPGAYAVMSVTDTGVGMPDEVLRLMFEPFFSTKPRTRGAGLGLASVFGIVAQSGGHVTADSTPLQGTTVAVYLPEVPHPAPSATTRTPATPVPATGATILLVEDNQMLRNLNRSVLASRGYTVIDAADADAAEQVAAGYDGHIHLLLTDVIMPGRTGVALAESLTARRPALRTLFASGHADDALWRHGVTVSAPNFLAKPYTPQVLLRKVADVLGNTSGSIPENRHL